jgi:SOS-response transcriptional repressor LexA
MREDEQLKGVSIHAGFPNPAADKSLGELNLNQLLVQNTASTFLFRLRGSEWESLGIFDGDIAIVDRALTPRKTDLVIWWSEHIETFAISKRQAAPPNATIWGVVTTVIHQFRKDER